MYKANMKHFLTLLIAVLSLLPSTMKAAGNKVITSLDLTIPVPQAGMTVQEGEELKLTAAKTSYGDLVQQGIASIMNIIWEGEFDTKDPSHPKFKAGYSYRASIKVMLDTKGPYTLKYQMRDGDYYVDDTMIKITVNGAPAREYLWPLLPQFQRCVHRAWRQRRQSGEGKPVWRLHRQQEEKSCQP